MSADWIQIQTHQSSISLPIPRITLQGSGMSSDWLKIRASSIPYLLSRPVHNPPWVWNEVRLHNNQGLFQPHTAFPVQCASNPAVIQRKAYLMKTPPPPAGSKAARCCPGLFWCGWTLCGCFPPAPQNLPSSRFLSRRAWSPVEKKTRKKKDTHLYTMLNEWPTQSRRTSMEIICHVKDLFMSKTQYQLLFVYLYSKTSVCSLI